MKAFFTKSYNVFALAMLIVIAVSILIPPICAVPDAGEYFGTFTRTGFYQTSEYSVSLSYGLDTPKADDLTFFERFLTCVASINKAVYSDTVFDIRFLSVLYMLVFMASVYFFLKNMHTGVNVIDYTLGAVMLVFFCDLGYISYFNSFYASALNLVLVFAMLSLAVALNKNFKFWKLILFTIVSVLYIFTMYQNFVAGAVAAVLLAIVSIRKIGAERIVGIICAVVLLASSVVSFSDANIPTKNENVFNSVFYGVLMDNPNAENALLEFGLDGHEDLIGKTSYEVKPEDIALVENIGYGKIMAYYAKNPGLLLDKMDMAAKNSYFLVQDFLNYNKLKPVPLSLWNTLKRKVLPQSLWIILIYAVAFFVMAVKEYKKKGGVYALSLVLPLALVTELLYSFISNGGVLISMKLFGFGIYLDIMLMLTIAWGIDAVLSRRKEIKEKYGVNQ